MSPTNIRVMLVDDCDILREGIRVLIRKKPNIEVVGEARTGEKAVHLAKQLTPDVIIMDFKMPGINGVEASEQIMHDNPDVKILLMSADLTDTIMKQAVNTGITGLLSKESACDQLADAIYAVHKGRIFYCTRVREMLQETSLVH